jgi:IstB-like ATP binding protein
MFAVCFSHLRILLLPDGRLYSVTNLSGWGDPVQCLVCGFVELDEDRGHSCFEYINPAYVECIWCGPSMLKQPMIEKLLAMRLHGMAEALKTQEQDAAARELSFLERLGLLVDQQWNWRENEALARRLKNAKLRTNACVEDIDYRGARGLDKSVIRALTQESAWVGTHENVFVLGSTGVGKSFVACALAQKACRDGYSALYTRAQSLFRGPGDGACGWQPAQPAGAVEPHRRSGDRRLGHVISE